MFRIGIHVGNIMMQGDDLFGDAVNIAARLEALAEAVGFASRVLVHDRGDHHGTQPHCGAAVFAALILGMYQPRPGEHVGLLLSGGNTIAVNFDTQ